VNIDNLYELRLPLFMVYVCFGKHYLRGVAKNGRIAAFRADLGGREGGIRTSEKGAGRTPAGPAGARSPRDLLFCQYHPRDVAPRDRADEMPHNQFWITENSDCQT
jgi:hypothetical protein